MYTFHPGRIDQINQIDENYFPIFVVVVFPEFVLFALFVCLAIFAH